MPYTWTDNPCKSGTTCNVDTLNDSIMHLKYDNRESIPIGSVIPWTSTTIPDGYLECNGAAVSRSSFSELFAKIGTTFGTGDGITTFNLPDFRGEFLRGWDHNRGVDAGRDFGSWQTNELKSHNHIIPFESGYGTDRYGYYDFGATQGNLYNVGTEGNRSIADYTSSTGGNETRPRNIALIFIIKVKNIVGSDPAVQGANADTLGGLHASDFMLENDQNVVRFSNYIHNFTSNGYQILPSGLIIQWGITGTINNNSTGVWVTFPTAFQNTCIAVAVIGTANRGGAGEANNTVNSKINTGFSYTNGSPAQVFNYIAIGY